MTRKGLSGQPLSLRGVKRRSNLVDGHAPFLDSRFHGNDGRLLRTARNDMSGNFVRPPTRLSRERNGRGGPVWAPGSDSASVPVVLGRAGTRPAPTAAILLFPRPQPGNAFREAPPPKLPGGMPNYSEQKPDNRRFKSWT